MHCSVDLKAGLYKMLSCLESGLTLIPQLKMDKGALFIYLFPRVYLTYELWSGRSFHTNQGQRAGTTNYLRHGKA